MMYTLRMNTSLIIIATAISAFIGIHIRLIKTNKVGKGLPFLYASIALPIIVINLVLTGTLIRKIDTIQESVFARATKDQVEETVKGARPESSSDQLNQIQDSIDGVKDEVHDIWIAQ